MTTTSRYITRRKIISGSKHTGITGVELYDLPADADEECNLAQLNTPEYVSVIKKLKQHVPTSFVTLSALSALSYKGKKGMDMTLKAERVQLNYVGDAKPDRR